MLRAIVLASSPALRERLKVFARTAELQIAGETSDAGRAHALATEADLLIVWGAALMAQVANQLDPGAFDRNGGPAAQDRDVPAYAIVAVADDRRAASTLETLPVRGWAVVPEDASRDEVRAAIAAADAGLGARPVEWTARPRRVFAGERTADWAEPGVVDERLTEREQEVLEWLSQGLSNRRIAEQLGISEHTVKFHIAAIYGKLNASSRTEAVNHALRRGWLRL
jgi:DNA-binding NarL/FixJ family response regulator